MQKLVYFAMYNAHFFACIFEEKIRMSLYMGIMITYHGYNHPTHNGHKGEHYTWQNT